MFESLSTKFASAFNSLRSKGRLKAADIEEIAAEIKSALLDSDVALEVAEGFTSNIKVEALTKLDEINKSTNPAQSIFNLVNQELTAILGGATRRIRFAKNPPTVILLTGLQGAGKTSLAGKLAKWLKDQGNTPILIASDLQRPNAVTQLQVIGESVKIPVFAPEPGNGIGDPIAVAKAGVEFAKSKLHNIAIVDTAGRLGVDEELMQQARDIRDAIEPDEVFYVVDAMVGQDAVRTAKAFDSGVGIDSIILTKLDGDARGGAALSIATVLGKPIIFSATGEKLSDFDLFHPDRVASRILGLGDVQTLAEQAKNALDATQTKRLEEKFVKGEDFTLDDFLSQLEAMKRMGSMSKLLGMLPGANSGAMKKQLEQFDGSELIKTQAIVQSMTPAERNDPKILNGSRRTRIAKGSGRQVSDVNNLVDRFTQAQKVMKQMQQGKMPNIPGMPKNDISLPNGNLNIGKGERAAPPKKKSRSGNPAKRALEERG
jgi:signal recognition particle subunit SRP54